MIYLFTIAAAILAMMFTHSKRELRYGKLFFRKKRIINNCTQITERYKFKNATECTQYYNKLVAEFSCKSQTNSYDIDAWSANSFSFTNHKADIYRFGNIIQLSKTMRNTS